MQAETSTVSLLPSPPHFYTLILALPDGESIQVKKLLVDSIKLDRRKAADVSTDDADKAKSSKNLSVRCHRLAISLEEVIYI